MDRRGRLLAVAVALLIACSDPPASDSTGNRGRAERRQAEVPVLESARGDPGTRLPDGFVVAEGTTLIGPVMPNGVVALHNDVPVVDEGWSATLFAHGEPRQVMEDYLAQAESLGFVREDVPDENTWGLTMGVPEEDQQPAMCAGHGLHGDAPEEGVYGCAARAVLHSRGDPAVCFSLRLTRGEARGRFTSHLELRYYYPLPGVVDGEEPLCGADAFVVGNPSHPVPALPDAWPTLPAPGESLLASTPVADIRVLEGSTTVAPPFGDWCATAILEITGDPGGLLDGYLAQFEQQVGPPPGEGTARLVTEIDDNTTLYEDSWAGGDQHPWGFYTYLLVADDDPDWLRLKLCSEE